MKNKNFGFTLLELLVTLLIGAILMSIAIPSYNGLVTDGRISTAYNSMLGEISYTRSQAVKRAATVVICATTDGATCNSALWERGRLVFVDANEDGAVDGGDTLLKIFGSSQEGVTIRSDLLPSEKITFDGSGGVLSVGNLFMCDAGGATEAKGITLTMIGIAQKAYDTDATPNGTIDNINGGEVTCP